MSLLDRREFLTGALWATAAATAVSAKDVFMDSDEQDQQAIQTSLASHLIENHPELTPDVANHIAEEFGNINSRNPYAPYMAAISSGAAYTAVGKDSGFFHKFFVVGGLASFFGSAAGTVLSETPKTIDIRSWLETEHPTLPPQLTEAISNTLKETMDDKFENTAYLPAIITGFGKSTINRFLDRFDVNKNGPNVS